MPKIQVQVKTPFGEVILEGAAPEEILKILEAMPEDFLSKVSNFVSVKLASPLKLQLEGIVEYTTEGPVITAKEKLTHYEAIGLILYASERKTNTAAQIERLLQSCGIKAMVPARLNEMTKQGRVFKPDPARPEFKLTTQGERWIEDEVLPKLRESKGE